MTNSERSWEGLKFLAALLLGIFVFLAIMMCLEKLSQAGPMNKCTVNLPYHEDAKHNSASNTPYLAELDQDTGDVVFHFYGRGSLHVAGGAFNPSPAEDFNLQHRMHKRAGMLLLASKYRGCDGGR